MELQCPVYRCTDQKIKTIVRCRVSLWISAQDRNAVQSIVLGAELQNCIYVFLSYICLMAELHCLGDRAHLSCSPTLPGGSFVTQVIRFPLWLLYHLYSSTLTNTILDFVLNCASSFRRRASSSPASAVIIGTWRVSAEAFVFPHLQEVSVPVFHLQRLQSSCKKAECALLLSTRRTTLIILKIHTQTQNISRWFQ